MAKLGEVFAHDLQPGFLRPTAKALDVPHEHNLTLWDDSGKFAEDDSGMGHVRRHFRNDGQTDAGGDQRFYRLYLGTTAGDLDIDAMVAEEAPRLQTEAA